MPKKSVLDVKAKVLGALRPAIVRPHVAKALPRTSAPHPCLSRTTPTMHDDGAMSDASIYDGPCGPASNARYFVNTTTRFGGICASFGLDDVGNLFTISFTRTETTLLRLDPKTLDPLNAFALPPRDVKIWDAIFHVDQVFKSNAGAYFCIDSHGRIVVPTLDGDIWVVGQRPDLPKEHYFQLYFRIPAAIPKGDAIQAVLPVWDERPHGPGSVAPGGYWFLTNSGCVGVARPENRPQVRSFQMPNGERIGNSGALGKNGFFVVSERSLYCLALKDDVVTIVWQKPYTQGKAKPGQLAPGSGTTPTLLGDRYVAIGDNAETMNVCVFDQLTGEPLPPHPVFADQIGSACENSFVGHGCSYVVSNTFGYVNPMHMRGYQQSFGMVRLDVDEASGALRQKWYRPDVAPMSAVPKLSLANGLIYVYSMTWIQKPKLGPKAHLDLAGRWRWSVLGIDFETGETRYEQCIFEGKPALDHDNGWGTICPIGDQAVLIGMWRGAMRVATR